MPRPLRGYLAPPERPVGRVTTATEVVWHGAGALAAFLVPIADLEPFPGNPRRGDVDAVRASLRRFGQVRPILTAAENASRIVAGHHLVLAATADGWTHVAAIANEFDNEEEARAYLLADNRTSDLGAYRDDLLLEQLDAARKTAGLEGTGYSEAFVAELDAELKKAFAPSKDSQPRIDQRRTMEGDLGFVVNIYPGERKLDFAQQVKLLEREWGVKGTTDVVLRAVRDAALRLNQES